MPHSRGVMTEKRFSVYLLIDPRDRMPYYVGRTGDVDRRFGEHCDPNKDARMRVSRRTAEILGRSEGPPALAVLESHGDELSALTAEIFWIDLLTCRGIRLLNSRGNREWLLRRAEALAKPRGRRHGRPWSEADEQDLIRYRGAGLDLAEMSLLLGRSERSVKLMIEKRSQTSRKE